MASLYAKLIQLLITYLVMPLLSKLVVSIVEYFQAKKEEAERNANIDGAVEEFKNAQSDAEKEAAFLKLVRTRSN
jgi:predicted metal-dependent hydrolase